MVNEGERAAMAIMRVRLATMGGMGEGIKVKMKARIAKIARMMGGNEGESNNLAILGFAYNIP